MYNEKQIRESLIIENKQQVDNFSDKSVYFCSIYSGLVENRSWSAYSSDDGVTERLIKFVTNTIMDIMKGDNE